MTISNGFTPKPKENCSLGVDIPLAANHYLVELKKEIIVFQYDVVLSHLDRDQKEKVFESKDLARLLFNKLCQKYPNCRMFYDNRKLLYSMSLISENNEINEKIALNGRNFWMKLTKTTELKVNSKSNEDLASIQALQLMFTDKLSQDFLPVMRSFFIRDFEKANIGFNLNLWKGFYVSVRPSEIGFQLNVDVANGVFFEGGKNLIDLACEWYNCRKGELEIVAKNNHNGAPFIDDLKGKMIKTYMGTKKRIVGVGEVAATHKIEVNGKQVTIQEYFKGKNIVLKYPSLRCLNLGKCGKYLVYLPLELAETHLAHQKNLSPAETSQVIRITAVPCFERQNNIAKMIEKANINDGPLLKYNQVSTQLQMSRFIGKVLAAPDLDYGLGNNTKQKSQQRQQVSSSDIGRKGQWDNRNKLFHTTAKLKNWLAISFGVKIDGQQLNEFIDSVIKNANNHGLDAEEPLDYVVGDYNTFKKEREPALAAVKFFDDTIKKYKNVQFLLVILPGTTPLYSVLKTYGDLRSGIISQAVDENTIIKQKGRYDRLASNICMKINAKLGGKNFVLSETNNLFQQHLQKLYAVPLMIFGADVNHAAPINNETVESIAAVVGSIDRNCSYYAARMQAQQQPKGKSLELIYDLKSMVKELLEEFHKANKVFPHRLLFLRDGVSDGQFKQILNHEMNQIREACQMINSGYKPGITFIVIKKRHHTRLFPQRKQDEAGQNGNVPPGTLVDSNIITPNMFNFFLCSHMGIKGTSKPCHYSVLHDDNGFTLNQISLLCHYLCHIYSKSTTSVSYPAPTYYADLCAERGRLYLRQRLASNQTNIATQNIELHNMCKNRMIFL